MTRDEAIEQAKQAAKLDNRIMAVRNDYGDYSAWYHYEDKHERMKADAGAEAGGVLSCYVYPDGHVVNASDMKGPP